MAFHWLGRGPAHLSRWSSTGNSGGVIDGLTVNPIAAFSVRKMRDAYLGPAFRVRRSSDNSETDIGFGPTGDLDYVSLINFVQGQTGYIPVWYDQSGNGRNAVQIVAAVQPTVEENGVLNQIGQRSAFHGTGFQYLVMPNATIPTGASSWSLNVVTRITDLSSPNQGWFGAGVPGTDQCNSFRIEGNFNIRQYYFNDDLLSVTLNPGIFNTNRIFTAINRDGYRFLFDQVTGVGTSITGNPNVNAANNFLMRTTSNEHLKGLISEAIIFQAAMAPSDLIKVVLNQSNYYDVALV